MENVEKRKCFGKRADVPCGSGPALPSVADLWRIRNRNVKRFGFIDESPVWREADRHWSGSVDELLYYEREALEQLISRLPANDLTDIAALALCLRSLFDGNTGPEEPTYKQRLDRDSMDNALASIITALLELVGDVDLVDEDENRIYRRKSAVIASAHDCVGASPPPEFFSDGEAEQ